MTLTETDGRHGFDFLAGRKRMHIRRLADSFDPNCTEWVETEAHGEMRPILGGFGNIDTTTPIGVPEERYFEAATLRLFNPETGLWRLWWMSSRAPVLDESPLEGRFVDGHGQFYGDEEINGKPVRVRFEWFDTLTDSPRSEQAFSYDGGETWQVTWTMTFTREEAAA